jgi:hypothetical protein
MEPYLANLSKRKAAKDEYEKMCCFYMNKCPKLVVRISRPEPTNAKESN